MQIQVNVKYQVVIPKEARKKVGIKPGQRMNVNVSGDQIIFSPSRGKGELKWPEDYYKKLEDIWRGVDVDKYMEEERNSWDCYPSGLGNRNRSHSFCHN